MGIRARDIRERCKNRADPQVLYCMEALAEQQSVMKQQIVELALQFDRMLNVMNQLTDVAANMKSATEALSRKDDDDDLPPVTQ